VGLGDLVEMAHWEDRRMRRSIVLATALAVALGSAAPVAGQGDPVEDDPALSEASPTIDLQWKRVDLPKAGVGSWVEDIIAVDRGFIAVGGGARQSPKLRARVWASLTGRRWQPLPMSGSARQGTPYAITRTPGGGFAMVGQGRCAMRCAVAWRSPDGVTWERLAERFDESVMYDLAALDDRLFAVGCHTPGFHCLAGRVWVSDDDGASWDLLGDVPGIMFRAVTVADGMLVAGGDTDGFDTAQGTLATSPDGVDWTIHGHSDGFGWMRAAGSLGDQALVGGGEHRQSGVKIGATLMGSLGDGGLEPIESKAFRKGMFVDMASTPGGLLLAGVFQGKRGIIPYSLVATDLTMFVRERFPRADQRTYGEAKAVAFSNNGARAVAGGRSGDKGAMWFSRVAR
jgi:hypothetical protein